jgi:A/G-specific adenine glycosylase
MPHSSFSVENIAVFHRALSRWYQTHGRQALPWRNTCDPYAIYISEIMLQQTQVKTVLERYYAPFLAAFPTLRALAQADRQAVFKQWEGLGYYTRAANLHKAAIHCAGVLPDTKEALRALPGIGRNTASAVACFAFRQAVPVMEANVKRVLCRVFTLKEATEDTLWEKAELLLDRQNPFDYNQAMMDIGAMVCTRRNPRCDVCPLSGICLGKASPDAYPTPKAAKSTPVRKRIIIVLQDKKDGYYLLRRESKFLHGLYGFPEYDPDAMHISYKGKSYALADAAVIGQVTQVYSHFRLEAVVRLLCVPMDKKNMSCLLQRVTLKQMRDLPLSKADHKIMAMLKGYDTSQ